MKKVWQFLTNGCLYASDTNFVSSPSNNQRTEFHKTARFVRPWIWTSTYNKIWLYFSQQLALLCYVFHDFSYSYVSSYIGILVSFFKGHIHLFLNTYECWLGFDVCKPAGASFFLIPIVFCVMLGLWVLWVCVYTHNYFYLKILHYSICLRENLIKLLSMFFKLSIASLFFII